MTVRLTYQIAIVFCVVAIASISEGADSPTSKRVQVFRCEIDGKVTYSDTACERAADKTKVQTALHNTYKPEPLRQKELAPEDVLTLDDGFATEVSSGNASQKSPQNPKNKESASIAEAQARQKFKCQQINADLDRAKKTYYESHYEDAFGNVKSSDRKKDDKEIARLESERRNNRCRY
jgi:CRISPR/Cas system CSM-associated protein Csm5 (group 7 of RAMP superfamily)